MNDTRDFDRAVARWLDAGSDATPPEVIDSVLLAVRSMPQERDFGGLWRTPPLAMYVRVAAVIAIVAVAGIATFYAFGSGLNVGLDRTLPSDTIPAGDPRGPFLGRWVSTTDADGGTQTMTVRASTDGAVEMTGRDDVASVCSGTPSTTTGIGRLEGSTAFVVPSPVYTCDDGSEPQALSGPPLEEQLRDLTFVLEARTNTLTDNFGGVWLREGQEDPRPEPTTPAYLWPQSSLEEVREAQELADAGDPRYTWQVDPGLASDDPWLHLGEQNAEIIARLLREELGWEEFLFNPLQGGNDGDASADGTLADLVYIRCAPGETNPLYPNDPTWDGGECAPTIDELRYEAVSLDVTQLDRRGPSGIWVVTRSQILPPFEQRTPPSDTEVTELLNSFLEARVAGQGAERYLTNPDEAIPLLYETTGEVHYTRAEFERVRAPEWPYGFIELKLRLFAGETVVEQHFFIDPCARSSSGGCVAANEPLALDFYGGASDGIPATTENGQTVPDRYSIVDGEVIFAATDPPWRFQDWLGSSRTMSTLLWERVFGGIKVVADPLPVGTGCEADTVPADAEAWAERILSDPDIDATEPIPVRIAGIEALEMDLAPAPGASICDRGNEPLLFTSEEPSNFTDVSLWHPHSYRLYLLDVPAGSSRILAIVLFGPDQDLERIAEAAAPVLDSFEFRAR